MQYISEKKKQRKITKLNTHFTRDIVYILKITM